MAVYFSSRATRRRFSFELMVSLLITAGIISSLGKAQAKVPTVKAVHVSTTETEATTPFSFSSIDPDLAQSQLDPRRYRVMPPPYLPRTVTAEAWAYPANGFPLANLLSNALESCLTEESTDGISRVGRGMIPKNLRCARSVSYLLHRFVPKFQGHDRAETCARRIRATFHAKRSRVYNLQEQIADAPQGYLYVICLLSSPKSRVMHICFYDPDTQGVVGNSLGTWKTKSLEKFWPKYRYYYLLGIPVRTPQISQAVSTPVEGSSE